MKGYGELRNRSARVLARKYQCELQHTPARIDQALRLQAGQEGCDGDPYDTMQAAADHITELHATLAEVAEALRVAEGLYQTEAAGRARATRALRKVEEVLAPAAANRKFMQIANPARRCLNLIKTAIL